MSQNTTHLSREYITQGLVIIAGIGFLLIISQFAMNSGHPLDAAQAPPFTLNALDGQSINLSESIGEEVVVLDFFATWCPPCVKGLPAVEKIAHEFASQGVKVYAVNVGEDLETVSQFMDSQGLALEVLMDENGEVSDLYHVQGIPQTVIIAKNGLVHRVHVGVGSGFEDELREDIQSALLATEIQ